MPELHLLSPRGFRAGGAYAGIKTKRTNDVGLLVCDQPAAAAAVFTTNKVFAAPVAVGRDHIRGGKLRGVVVNSGNANACTGKRGKRDAYAMCELAADLIGCKPKEMLPSSTGIIGHYLPMTKLKAGIHAAAGALGDSATHALAFADAILTTDTKRKSAAVQLKIDRKTVTIAGVCKGSGMIGPRMSLPGKKHATMLAYLTTDARFYPSDGNLAAVLQQVSDESFNAVTVDDHASTNDTVCILASGASDVAVHSAGDFKRFQKALAEVCQGLAYQIAADGEGATKVVIINVTGAKTRDAARAIARAIANSPLVKCAMHGNDPNWGRIVSAAGYAGAEFDPAECVLSLQRTRVFDTGQPVAFDAAELSAAMNAAEVRIDLNCHLGKASATCWTCDLSKEYVTINADYHT